MFFVPSPIVAILPEWISIILPLCRMIAVCYFASKINDRSLETIEIINSISVENDMTEIRHFHDFLATTKVALSGMGFFFLTKRLIFTVIYKKLTH